MKVLVCGDRKWKDREYMFQVLDDIDRLYGVGELIEGNAAGADRMAGEWGAARNKTVRVFPADWDHYGKAAGILRNKRMLVSGEPDMVIAFHRSFNASKGTKHMVEIARAAGVRAYIFPHHTVELEGMFDWNATGAVAQ